ncbi:hypothetical protein [Candidatus Tisiphia endosymbiont of Beris chalybata]|uniref:hypothetical protein n=1 Tax=Candidatus Tisiphia endosymbiont of Beris chalybata TaxID=3066262 RepID=UPI00312C77F4
MTLLGYPILLSILKKSRTWRYCKATQRYHTNNMGSFDDILRSNESVYTLGPAYVGYFEATHPGLIRDHIICVSNSRAEYNNCDVNRDKCRDMNQPFKEGCYNARSECYSNLTQPCTDARSSCHQHKENERTLCTAARDQSMFVLQTSTFIM